MNSHSHDSTFGFWVEETSTQTSNGAQCAIFSQMGNRSFCLSKVVVSKS